MIILFIVEIAFTAFLYVTSRNKFQKLMSHKKDEKDKLKAFLPIGLQMMELIHHKYQSRYEKRLEAKLRELGDPKDCHELLKLFIAEKTVILLAALIFLTFIGTQVEMDVAYGIFAVGLMLLLFYVTDKQLDNKIKERKRSMQIEFPEFLNKLVLLVNAGLTVSGAIQKIVKDNKKANPLYHELQITINDINYGRSEVQSYEELSKRCRLPEVTAFVAALIQNLRKGDDELIPILKLQSSTCWENRKNNARKLGEEASTKLLVPMMLIFVAILIMVMAPAVFQINF